MALHLASTSPRRRDLLLAAGIEFVLAEPGDEIVGPSIARDRALARARAKAEQARVIDDAPGFVLGVDTIVVLDGREFGKPRDAAEAAATLAALSGQTHEVLTGHYLRPHPATGSGRGLLSCARVRCRPLDSARIDAHVASGAWRGKAGGYGIQDGSVDFMALVEGELDTVIGLSIAAVRELLAGAAQGGV